MTLETAAGLIADRISSLEYVEVYGHHDADGVAAAAIIATAILRKGGRFRVRIVSDINPDMLANPEATVLCDIGSGIGHLDSRVMVIDHHEPVFSGDFHVNPNLSGIDGERELSAAGAAYLVAQELGDNRDLAGLVMLGIIADRQEIAGKNLGIFNDSVAEGLIEPGRGIRLPGRDYREAFLTALDPYLDGISGNEESVSGLVELSGGPSGTDPGMLLSLAMVRMGRKASVGAMTDLYGDRFALAREVVEDANTLASLVDACGKAGRGGLALSLCLRSQEGIGEAWEVASSYRLAAIAAIREASAAEHDGFCKVGNPAVAGAVAGALANDLVRDTPVAVYAESGGLCHISARNPGGRQDPDLGALMREVAAACGGHGGGHRGRAGATIGCSEMPGFMKGWQEAL